MTLSADEQPAQPTRIVTHVDRAGFVRGVVDACAEALRDTLDRQAVATLAVPGGRTMSAVLPALAAEQVRWDRVRVVLVDERWVPASHPDSNEALIRKLFEQASPNVTVHGLFAAGLTPQDGIGRLASLAAPDVVLLSMAEDGHIGSLFPGDPANHADTPFAVVHRPDHVRITMTPKHLCAAQTIILAVDGAAREQMLLSAQNRGSRLPVHHVLRPDTQVHVLR